MHAKQIAEIEKKYLNQKHIAGWDEMMIIDKEILEEILGNFNEVLIAMSPGEINYCDQVIIKQIYLTIFPEVYGLIPESASDIQLALLNYYHYLYQEEFLNKEEYLGMLLFFQTNQKKFFNRIMQEFLDDEAGINTERLHQEPKNKETYPKQNQEQHQDKGKLKNNVISVEFGQTKPKD